MKNYIIYCTVAVSLFWNQASLAQTASPSSVWIQLEAQPDRATALESVAQYKENFDNIVGFDIGAGWFGIALGPYQEEAADRFLQEFLNASLVPRSSFITTGTSYQRQIFPSNEARIEPTQNKVRKAPFIDTAPNQDTASSTLALVPDIAPNEDTATPSNLAPTEQLIEASFSEQAMTLAEKKYLQRALAWAGFYENAIDGLYGRGTRGAMARWQISKGYEDTGILTATQRAELIANYQILLAGLGFTETTAAKAGIAILAPSAILEAAQYDAPFVQYRGREGSIVQVILISQTGDSARLKALYEVLQTLSIIPKDGRRKLTKSSFTIDAIDTAVHTTGFARLRDGEIKGAFLVWPIGDDARRQRVENEVFNSFTRLPGALPDASIFDAELTPSDLLSGLKIRPPAFTQSGVFLNPEGYILTAKKDFSSCGTIELENGITLRIAAQNAKLTILEPKLDTAPAALPKFQTAPLRAPRHISVGGYAYGGKLGAPTLTLGLLQDIKNLAGERNIARLEIDTLPGDIGGPLYDQSGAVIGILLSNPKNGERRLPSNVHFAATWGWIEPLLQKANIIVTKADTVTAVDAIDLSNITQNTVALVKCWD